MKAFRFRLEAVLKLREQAEEAAREHCAKAFAAVEKSTSRLRAVDADISASDELRRQHLTAGAPAGQLEQLRTHSVLLHERRIAVERELAEAKRRADAAQKQLLLASQRRETLTKLRDRQLRLHDYEAARAEQKLLDELAARSTGLVTAWREPCPVL